MLFTQISSFQSAGGALKFISACHLCDVSTCIQSGVLLEKFASNLKAGKVFSEPDFRSLAD